MCGWYVATAQSWLWLFSSVPQRAKAVRVKKQHLCLKARKDLHKQNKAKEKKSKITVFTSSTMSRPAHRRPEYQKIVRSFYKHIFEDIWF